MYINSQHYFKQISTTLVVLTMTNIFLWQIKIINKIEMLFKEYDIHFVHVKGYQHWQIMHKWLLYIPCSMSHYFIFLVNKQTEGWELKRSKCFFTYIYLNLFCFHSSKYSQTGNLTTYLTNYGSTTMSRIIN